LAKRPIANAAWKDIRQQPGMYQNYAATYTERFKQMGLTAASLGFADSDWPEVALRFTLSQPGVHCAIIGTTNPDNARANLAAAEKGALPEDVVRKIRDAFARAEKASGQAWTGQT
jgi:aryl-alcohol dehydrogenase-like predicted oxidoreductase